MIDYKGKIRYFGKISLVTYSNNCERKDISNFQYIKENYSLNNNIIDIEASDIYAGTYLLAIKSKQNNLLLYTEERECQYNINLNSEDNKAEKTFYNYLLSKIPSCNKISNIVFTDMDILCTTNQNNIVFICRFNYNDLLNDISQSKVKDILLYYNLETYIINKSIMSIRPINQNYDNSVILFEVLFNSIIHKDDYELLAQNKLLNKVLYDYNNNTFKFINDSANFMSENSYTKQIEDINSKYYYLLGKEIIKKNSKNNTPIEKENIYSKITKQNGNKIITNYNINNKKLPLNNTTHNFYFDSKINYKSKEGDNISFDNWLLEEDNYNKNTYITKNNKLSSKLDMFKEKFYKYKANIINKNNSKFSDLYFDDFYNRDNKNNINSVHLKKDTNNSNNKIQLEDNFNKKNSDFINNKIMSSYKNKINYYYNNISDDKKGNELYNIKSPNLSPIKNLLINGNDKNINSIYKSNTLYNSNNNDKSNNINKYKYNDKNLSKNICCDTIEINNSVNNHNNLIESNSGNDNNYLDNKYENNYSNLINNNYNNLIPNENNTDIPNNELASSSKSKIINSSYNECIVDKNNNIQYQNIDKAFNIANNKINDKFKLLENNNSNNSIVVIDNSIKSDKNSSLKSNNDNLDNYEEEKDKTFLIKNTLIDLKVDSNINYNNKTTILESNINSNINNNIFENLKPQSIFEINNTKCNNKLSNLKVFNNLSCNNIINKDNLKDDMCIAVNCLEPEIISYNKNTNKYISSNGYNKYNFNFIGLIFDNEYNHKNLYIEKVHTKNDLKNYFEYNKDIEINNIDIIKDSIKDKINCKISNLIIDNAKMNTSDLNDSINLIAEKPIEEYPIDLINNEFTQKYTYKDFTKYISNEDNKLYNSNNTLTKDSKNNINIAINKEHTNSICILDYKNDINSKQNIYVNSIVNQLTDKLNDNLINNNYNNLSFNNFSLKNNQQINTERNDEKNLNNEYINIIANLNNSDSTNNLLANSYNTLDNNKDCLFKNINKYKRVNNKSSNNLSDINTHKSLDINISKNKNNFNRNTIENVSKLDSVIENFANKFLNSTDIIEHNKLNKLADVNKDNLFSQDNATNEFNEFEINSIKIKTNILDPKKDIAIVINKINTNNKNKNKVFNNKRYSDTYIDTISDINLNYNFKRDSIIKKFLDSFDLKEYKKDNYFFKRYTHLKKSKSYSNIHVLKDLETVFENKNSTLHMSYTENECKFDKATDIKFKQIVPCNSSMKFDIIKKEFDYLENKKLLINNNNIQKNYYQLTKNNVLKKTKSNSFNHISLIKTSCNNLNTNYKGINNKELDNKHLENLLTKNINKFDNSFLDTDSNHNIKRQLHKYSDISINNILSSLSRSNKNIQYKNKDFILFKQDLVSRYYCLNKNKLENIIYIKKSYSNSNDKKNDKQTLKDIDNIYSTYSIIDKINNKILDKNDSMYTNNIRRFNRGIKLNNKKINNIKKSTKNCINLKKKRSIDIKKNTSQHTNKLSENCSIKNQLVIDVNYLKQNYNTCKNSINSLKNKPLIYSIDSEYFKNKLIKDNSNNLKELNNSFSSILVKFYPNIFGLYDKCFLPSKNNIVLKKSYSCQKDKLEKLKIINSINKRSIYNSPKNKKYLNKKEKILNNNKNNYSKNIINNIIDRNSLLNIKNCDYNIPNKSSSFPKLELVLNKYNTNKLNNINFNNKYCNTNTKKDRLSKSNFNDNNKKIFSKLLYNNKNYDNINNSYFIDKSNFEHLGNLSDSFDYKTINNNISKINNKNIYKEKYNKDIYLNEPKSNKLEEDNYPIYKNYNIINVNELKHIENSTNKNKNNSIKFKYYLNTNTFNNSNDMIYINDTKKIENQFIIKKSNSFKHNDTTKIRYHDKFLLSYSNIHTVNYSLKSNKDFTINKNYRSIKYNFKYTIFNMPSLEYKKDSSINKDKTLESKVILNDKNLSIKNILNMFSYSEMNSDNNTIKDICQYNNNYKNEIKKLKTKSLDMNNFDYCSNNLFVFNKISNYNNKLINNNSNLEDNICDNIYDNGINSKIILLNNYKNKIVNINPFVKLLTNYFHRSSNSLYNISNILIDKEDVPLTFGKNYKKNNTSKNNILYIKKAYTDKKQKNNDKKLLKYISDRQDMYNSYKNLLIDNYIRDNIVRNKCSNLDKNKIREKKILSETNFINNLSINNNTNNTDLLNNKVNNYTREIIKSFEGLLISNSNSEINKKYLKNKYLSNKELFKYNKYNLINKNLKKSCNTYQINKKNDNYYMHKINYKSQFILSKHTDNKILESYNNNYINKKLRSYSSNNKIDFYNYLNAKNISNSSIYSLNNNIYKNILDNFSNPNIEYINNNLTSSNKDKNTNNKIISFNTQNSMNTKDKLNIDKTNKIEDNNNSNLFKTDTKINEKKNTLKTLNTNNMSQNNQFINLLKSKKKYLIDNEDLNKNINKTSSCSLTYNYNNLSNSNNVNTKKSNKYVFKSKSFLEKRDDEYNNEVYKSFNNTSPSKVKIYPFSFVNTLEKNNDINTILNYNKKNIYKRNLFNSNNKDELIEIKNITNKLKPINDQDAELIDAMFNNTSNTSYNNIKTLINNKSNNTDENINSNNKIKKNNENINNNIFLLKDSKLNNRNNSNNKKNIILKPSSLDIYDKLLSKAHVEISNELIKNKINSNLCTSDNNNLSSYLDNTNNLSKYANTKIKQDIKDNKNNTTLCNEIINNITLSPINTDKNKNKNEDNSNYNLTNCNNIYKEKLPNFLSKDYNNDYSNNYLKNSNLNTSLNKIEEDINENLINSTNKKLYNSLKNSNIDLDNNLNTKQMLNKTNNYSNKELLITKNDCNSAQKKSKFNYSSNIKLNLHKMVSSLNQVKQVENKSTNNEKTDVSFKNKSDKELINLDPKGNIKSINSGDPNKVFSYSKSTTKIEEFKSKNNIKARNTYSNILKNNVIKNSKLNNNKTSLKNINNNINNLFKNIDKNYLNKNVIEIKNNVNIKKDKRIISNESNKSLSDKNYISVNDNINDISKKNSLISNNTNKSANIKKNNTNNYNKDKITNKALVKSEFSKQSQEFNLLNNKDNTLSVNYTDKDIKSKNINDKNKLNNKNKKLFDKKDSAMNKKLSYIEKAKNYNKKIKNNIIKNKNSLSIKNNNLECISDNNNFNSNDVYIYETSININNKSKNTNVVDSSSNNKKNYLSNVECTDLLYDKNNNINILDNNITLEKNEDNNTKNSYSFNLLNNESIMNKLNSNITKNSGMDYYPYDTLNNIVYSNDDNDYTDYVNSMSNRFKESKEKQNYNDVSIDDKRFSDVSLLNNLFNKSELSNNFYNSKVNKSNILDNKKGSFKDSNSNNFIIQNLDNIVDNSISHRNTITDFNYANFNKNNNQIYNDFIKKKLSNITLNVPVYNLDNLKYEKDNNNNNSYGFMDIKNNNKRSVNNNSNNNIYECQESNKSYNYIIPEDTGYHSSAATAYYYNKSKYITNPNNIIKNKDNKNLGYSVLSNNTRLSNKDLLITDENNFVLDSNNRLYSSDIENNDKTLNIHNKLNFNTVKLNFKRSSESMTKFFTAKWSEPMHKFQAAAITKLDEDQYTFENMLEPIELDKHEHGLLLINQSKKNSSNSVTDNNEISKQEINKNNSTIGKKKSKTVISLPRIGDGEKLYKRQTFLLNDSSRQEGITSDIINKDLIISEADNKYSKERMKTCKDTNKFKEIIDNNYNKTNIIINNYNKDINLLEDFQNDSSDNRILKSHDSYIQLINNKNNITLNNNNNQTNKVHLSNLEKIKEKIYAENINIPMQINTKKKIVDNNSLNPITKDSSNSVIRNAVENSYLNSNFEDIIKFNENQNNNSFISNYLNLTNRSTTSKRTVIDVLTEETRLYNENKEKSEKSSSKNIKMIIKK